MWKILITLTLLTLTLTTTHGYNNGMGKTPAMGFNSWNHYAAAVNQTVMVSTAEALVSTGLAAKGYVYVGLDDGWAWNRTANGTITAEPATFPDGIAALAARVHALGLRFGIYSSLGTKTCLGRPGTLGYETQDADTYALWGVDLVKMDNCANENISPEVRYPKMSKALNATGRPMLFAMCEWGDDNPATWAPAIAQQWRISVDIKDFWVSVMHNADESNKWWKQAAPYGFNQADILEVGNGGLTRDENIAHFALWAIIKSPLLIGCSVVDMPQDILSLLGNQALIAWNQDPLGVQGHLVASYADPDALSGTPLSSQDLALKPCLADAPRGLFSTPRSEAQAWIPGAPLGTGAAARATNTVFDRSTGFLVSSDRATCSALGPSGTSLVSFPCKESDQVSTSPFTVDPEFGSLFSVAQDGRRMCLSIKDDDLTFDLQVWAGPLDNGRFAVLLLNRGLIPRHITAHWSDVGLKDGTPMTVVDVITNISHGTSSSSFSALVSSHGVVALELSPPSASTAQV